MTKEEQEKKEWSNYLIEGTEILKNKLNIRDKEELKEAEKIVTRKTLAKLYLKPVGGKFDLEHLKKIHKQIFSPIYPFAGELRTCTLQKNNYVFCEPEIIEEQVDLLLEEMNTELDDNISSIQELAFKLGKYYYNLIFFHPFREGNGRSVRTFIREVVLFKSKNYKCGPLDLDYTKMDKENLFLGTAQRYIYPSNIEIELMKGIVPIEIENNKTL